MADLVRQADRRARLDVVAHHDSRAEHLAAIKNLGRVEPAEALRQRELFFLCFALALQERAAPLRSPACGAAEYADCVLTWFRGRAKNAGVTNQ